MSIRFKEKTGKNRSIFYSMHDSTLERLTVISTAKIPRLKLNFSRALSFSVQHALQVVNPIIWPTLYRRLVFLYQV